MAAQGLVVKVNGNLEVKGRRKLGDEATFNAMIEELSSAISSLKEVDANACISDLDVSQNHLQPEQFETLFQTLALGGMRVQRFRMFGCPTLNDEALRHISDHFRQDLTNETAPLEMHLSDCAITSDGFSLFITTIEETDLYPYTDARTEKSIPLYLRLENNYIDDAVIQEKVDVGTIRCHKKQAWGARIAIDGSPKVDLVVMQEGKFNQKPGPPPAPEDAPPPKQVWDKHEEGKGGNKGGKSWGQPQWGQPQWAQNQGKNWQSNLRPGNATPLYNQMWPAQSPQQWQQQKGAAGQMPWQRTTYQAGAKGSAASEGVGRPTLIVNRGGAGQTTRPAGQTVRPAWAAGKGTAGQTAVGQTIRPAGQTVRPAWVAFKGTAGQATDRSRTPAARSGGSPAPPVQPPAGKKDLPPPWEEHYSDEFKIPYFWNAETGEALWEKP